MKLTRRSALRSASGAILLPSMLQGRTRAAPMQATTFQHGVASGDPDARSFVIWTRASGINMPQPVDWEVAADPEFDAIVSRGSARAMPERDFTVKVLVTGLEAGRRYFYRFRHADDVSAVGRGRTLPLGHVEALTLAVTSCSNFPFGYFNAYEAIARDEAVDWVIHLGDYLYEYGVDGYGAASGAFLGREHAPPHEIVTLADYRERHAQYKRDPQSQLMHAAHSLLAIWDDHEVTNNPWSGGAQNHQPAQEGPWPERRAAALQAWFEWMPVRDPMPGHAPWDYWRHWRFGSLASLISLETRHSARAKQIDYVDYLDELVDEEAAERFLRDVVGAPGRRMLSPAMEDFLRQALTESTVEGRPWKLLANQIPMARTAHPRFSADEVAALRSGVDPQSLERLELIVRAGELGLPLYLDPWDGYPVARESLYGLSASCGVRDLLVLTGDSHSFWQNRLVDAGGGPMGLELGTTGITSPGDFVEFGPRGATLIDGALARSNPEILWTECRHNGYLRLSLHRDEARADFIAVETISSPSPTTRTLRSADIVHDAGTLAYR